MEKTGDEKDSEQREAKQGRGAEGAEVLSLAGDSLVLPNVNN